MLSLVLHTISVFVSAEVSRKQRYNGKQKQPVKSSLGTWVGVSEGWKRL